MNLNINNHRICILIYWKDHDTSNKHGENAEYLLVTSVGRDVAEANTREAGAGEVERCDVRLCVRHVLNRHLELLCQGVGPACNTTQQNIRKNKSYDISVYFSSQHSQMETDQILKRSSYGSHFTSYQPFLKNNILKTFYIYERPQLRIYERWTQLRTSPTL